MRLNDPEFIPNAQKSLMVNPVLAESWKKATNGGLAGASAMAVQVGSLMWLRTTMNYQYRYGLTTMETLKKLYSQGGISRFYRGLAPALVQGPISRFGDTAINTGVLHYCNNSDSLQDLPIFIKTNMASMGAAGWRISTMPIDTCKTIMQVEGKRGLPVLREKMRIGGPQVLYHGALGAMTATYAGHFPWFFTYNYLDATVPAYDSPFKQYSRSGVIGFASSVVSDTCSNSLRVVKTYRQTSHDRIGYFKAAKSIVRADGLKGLFTRGLQTRIIANGLQGLLFSVLWKYFQQNHFT